VVDLLVGQFLGGAEQAVAGVADDDVDAPELLEAAVHNLADRLGVGDVEQFAAERVGVAVGEVGDGLGAADGADDGVAAVEELGGQLAAEAAADASDEPGARCHVSPFPGPGATSLMAARALRVRG